MAQTEGSVNLESREDNTEQTKGDLRRASSFAAEKPQRREARLLQSPVASLTDTHWATISSLFTFEEKTGKSASKDVNIIERNTYISVL